VGKGVVGSCVVGSSSSLLLLAGMCVGDDAVPTIDVLGTCVVSSLSSLRGILCVGNGVVITIVVIGACVVGVGENVGTGLTTVETGGSIVGTDKDGTIVVVTFKSISVAGSAARATVVSLSPDIIGPLFNVVGVKVVVGRNVVGFRVGTKVVGSNVVVGWKVVIIEFEDVGESVTTTVVVGACVVVSPSSSSSCSLLTVVCIDVGCCSLSSLPSSSEIVGMFVGDTVTTIDGVVGASVGSSSLSLLVRMFVGNGDVTTDVGPWVGSALVGILVGNDVVIATVGAGVRSAVGPCVCSSLVGMYMGDTVTTTTVGPCVVVLVVGIGVWSSSSSSSTSFSSPSSVGGVTVVESSSSPGR